MAIQEYRDQGPTVISPILHLESLKDKSVIITGGTMLNLEIYLSITHSYGRLQWAWKGIRGSFC